MKCPFCGDLEDKVIDSRISKDGFSIRRRRECISCRKRFTTHEKIEETLPSIIKKDGRREPYDRQKLEFGIRVACGKRPIPAERVQQVVDEIETAIFALSSEEVPSRVVGELVMEKLRDLDQIAYIRFASIYRSFADLEAVREEVENLLQR